MAKMGLANLLSDEHSDLLGFVAIVDSILVLSKEFGAVKNTLSVEEKIQL